MTALPAGSSPAATRPAPPLEAGGTTPATPTVAVAPSASAVRCPHCEAGHPRMPDGMHVRVSERGIENLGKCPRPDEVVFVRREDSACWFRQRLAEMNERIAASRKPMPMPVTSREPGEDDDAD